MALETRFCRTRRNSRRSERIASELATRFIALVQSLETPPGSDTPVVKVDVVAGPLLNPTPVAPRPVRNLALGLILGLLIGVGLALLREALDVTVKTAEALRASEADERASVVLVAVVREFDSKADKANRQANDDASARDSVIELEQAGDSAKAAAEADPNLGEPARQAVLDAHLAICILKTEI